MKAKEYWEKRREVKQLDGMMPSHNLFYKHAYMDYFVKNEIAGNKGGIKMGGLVGLFAKMAGDIDRLSEDHNRLLDFVFKIVEDNDLDIAIPKKTDE